MEVAYVAYYRVSTDRQGRSGLGLDAQRKAVVDFLNGGQWTLLGEFTEVESGKRNDRLELKAALAMCRRKKARLVIARLDRLSRNLAFIATLMESGVEFVAADNPHANKLTIHILAAVAQGEREAIASRTKAALQAAKKRGVKLGVYGREKLSKENRKQADSRAKDLSCLFNEMLGKQLSANAMARHLNEQGVAPARGRKWYPVTVIRVLKRLGRIKTPL
jgi:DNA invertase Pin-like site-specific DNA recombinase